MNDNSDVFTHKLARGFSAIERRHRKFMNRALKEEGFVGVAYSYVIAIKKNPGLNQDFLADFQGVDKSRVARIVRDLELGGYVSRELSPKNRRQYMLVLTQSGEKLYDLIMDKTRQWEALVSGGIDGGDIATTMETIDKIIKNLDK